MSRLAMMCKMVVDTKEFERKIRETVECVDLMSRRMWVLREHRYRTQRRIEALHAPEVMEDE